MSIVVEHENRKHEILDKALDIFLEEGYSGASYQKIADRCGIARTILYTYFKNKREIFRFTIKQVTESLERSFEPFLEDPALSAADKIELIVVAVVEKCVEERKLFSIILDYLLEQRREKGRSEDLIRRRVIRLRMLLSRILIDGMKSGQIRKTDVKGLTEAIYSLIEGAIMKLAIMEAPDVVETVAAIRALSVIMKA